MPQITARLSREARQEFEEYAQSLGLTGASLARLLIVRALGSPLKPRRKRHHNIDGKITAHFRHANVVKQFKRYAGRTGLSNAKAAKQLFERELKYRWLYRKAKAARQR